MRLLLEGHCYELSRAVGARLVAEGAAIGGGYAGGGEWLRLKNYP